MADSDSWDAENLEEANEPLKSPAGLQDRWEGEDEEDDVKDNWDDEEEEHKAEEQKTEVNVPAKKKPGSKIKEKENEKEKKEEEELRKRLEESEVDSQLTPEEQAAEKLRVQKLQEESDMVLACEAFGVDTTTTNSASGIEAMCPSTKEDFVVFEKLLRDKITPFEKSAHYSSFLESLFRELCLSLELDDFKTINNSMTVLLSEKQKQEKEKAKGAKKKKKIVLAGGGVKAKMKTDFDDYGNFDGSYNDYEDFM